MFRGIKHAIELTSACVGGTYTFTSNTFTGYASSNGSTGNEAIYNNSGGLLLANIISVLPSIRGSGASTIVNNAVSLTIKLWIKIIALSKTHKRQFRTSDDLQLMNGDTNASGVAHQALIIFPTQLSMLELESHQQEQQVLPR